MGEFASLVRLATTALFETRRDLILLAARHRAKFEHWLKFELAMALDAHPHITSVEPEVAYGKRNLCDIACQTDEGKYLLELKTCNTSWRVKGCVTKTKPITDNVGGVIHDIKKLRAGCKATGGISVFLFFPVPDPLWNGKASGLRKQLSRIEREGRLPREQLRNTGVFIELTRDFGLASFVVEVVRPGAA